MKKKLLCTFVIKNQILHVLTQIQKQYLVLYNKILIYENEGDSEQYLCVYHIDPIKMENIQYTISLHRKSKTNTLYTINALNEFIKEVNNGVLDKSFLINWDTLKDCILMTNNNELIRNNIHLLETYSINN